MNGILFRENFFVSPSLNILTWQSHFNLYFGEFWPPFIGLLIGLWITQKLSPATRFPFWIFKEKAFPQLSEKGERERSSLLRSAIEEAFGGWSWWIPNIVFASFFATGYSVARIIGKEMSEPLPMLLFFIFILAGGWISSKVINARVRRVLGEGRINADE
jgi:hypothetical protein